MRRPSGIFLACALMVLTASLASAQAPATPAPATPAPATQPAQPAAPPLNFTGDMVLWAFSINPDKTADYEQVLAKLKESLQKITRPEAKQQLAGWKVIKNSAPQPDGTILYIHIVDVVKGADYSINNIVYEAFTDYETRQKFYEMYKGAVKSAFFVIQGPLVSNLAN